MTAGVQAAVQPDTSVPQTLASTRMPPPFCVTTHVPFLSLVVNLRKRTGQLSRHVVPAHTDQTSSVHARSGAFGMRVWRLCEANGKTPISPVVVCDCDKSREWWAWGRGFALNGVAGTEVAFSLTSFERSANVVIVASR